MSSFLMDPDPFGPSRSPKLAGQLAPEGTEHVIREGNTLVGQGKATMGKGQWYRQKYREAHAKPARQPKYKIE